MSLAPGTKLGPYEIIAPAGAGAMGEVYRARDSRLNRDVALKVLPAAFSRDSDRLSRFQQEAQAVASLNHPNIMAIHDFGEHDGAPYIVAELLEGETLRDRMRGGALPMRKVTEYAEQIARGLAAAHDKGIVHRDLKPENIFVTRDGRVKILDFGLAKLTRPEGVPSTDAATLVSQTEPGVVMGTVGYMSPEQVKGQPADHRSDLFSFGAILYEMLSGRRAFRGDTSVETMSAILKEDPPELSETNRNVAPAMERMVRHCLEKTPEERFQSARDVAFNLQNLSGSTSQLAAMAPAKSSTATTGRLAAIGFLSLAALAAVFWAGGWLKSAPSPTFKPLTFRRGTVTAARFAPDGQNVIYSASWEGSPHPDLYSTQIDGVLSRPLDVADADLLSISPQGEMALLEHWHRTLGWERTGTLARLPLSGGASKEMLDGVQEADWARDGTRLAVIRATPPYQLEFPLGHVLVTATQSRWFQFPRISPDQQHVAFFEHPPGDDRGDVCIVDLSGNKRVLAGGWSSLWGLSWSPSGNEVWFTGSNTGSSRSLYAVSLSGRVRQVLRVPGSMVLLDIAPDGRVLLSQDDNRRWIVGLTPGSPQERDLTWLDWSNPRDLTPDGRFLLIDEQGEGGGPDYSIYIRKTDGSPAVRLGDHDAFSISDDGKWVLATTTAEGGALVLLPTGAGESRTIKTGNLRDPLGVFLPDGKHILVVPNDFRVHVESLDGDTPRPVMPAGVRPIGPGRTFTADGKYVLGSSVQKKWALYPIEGGEAIPLPNWNADDEPINHTTDNHSFFVSNGVLPVNIYRYDFLKGTRQLVRQLRPADATGIEGLSSVFITPDGKYYVYGGSRRLSTLFVATGLK